MNFKAMLFLLAGSALLQACAPTGPVQFYEGAPRPTSEIAKVMVPGPLTVESIDGRKVDVPSQDEGFYELQLPPGKHIIAFKYLRFWGSGDAGSMIRSDLAAVDSTFEAGKVYELTYNKPRDEEQASALASDFSATLVDRSSGQKTASFTVANLDAALLARKSQQPATPVPTKATAAAAMPSADQAVQEDPVKRLKFWWLMANEKQRNEFSEWMKSATPSFGQE